MKQTVQSEKIRKAAAELFAQKGYNGVGVAEIGKATGFGRGALYHHIESKEDILFDIASRYISDLVDAGRRISAEIEDPVTRLEHLSTHLMSIVSTNLPEIIVCFREVQALKEGRYEQIMCLHTEYQELWEKAIADGQKKGVFRPIDKIAVKGLLGMYFYSCLWLNPDGSYSAEEIADVFSDLTIRSLLT